MNFEFSESQEMLRDQSKSFLSNKSVQNINRMILDGDLNAADSLWKEMAALGWMGAAIPEEYGGSGLGHLELCVLAEEMGRTVTPTPFSTSVYLATEAILMAGSNEQKQKYLPGLASGELIGTFAVSEGNKMPSANNLTVKHSNNTLTGIKMPVPDGMSADFAIVANKEAWFIVDLNGKGIFRRPLKSLDPGRAQAEIVFDNAIAEPLITLTSNINDNGSDQFTENNQGWILTEQLFDRAAILFAFEQVGGALSCLDQARNYALDRFAFGRPIATYQAIKHKLADMYVAATLARSNCYYGAWALDTQSHDLTLAAATARVSATKAFDECSSENIQTHGGMGFTWEFDCHLYYRRARALALNIGNQLYWEDRLISQIEAQKIVA